MLPRAEMKERYDMAKATESWVREYAIGWWWRSIQRCVLQITAGAGGAENCGGPGMPAHVYDVRAANATRLQNNRTGLPGRWCGWYFAGSHQPGWEGDFAYGAGPRKGGKPGVHRLVRISPFDGNANAIRRSRIQYMYRWLMVFYRDRILGWCKSLETFRSGGAGGQNVGRLQKLPCVWPPQTVWALF